MDSNARENPTQKTSLLGGRTLDLHTIRIQGASSVGTMFRPLRVGAPGARLRVANGAEPQCPTPPPQTTPSPDQKKNTILCSDQKKKNTILCWHVPIVDSIWTTCNHQCLLVIVYGPLLSYSNAPVILNRQHRLEVQKLRLHLLLPSPKAFYFCMVVLVNPFFRSPPLFLSLYFL